MQVAVCIVANENLKWTIINAIEKYQKSFFNCTETSTGLVTSKLGVFASIDRTVSQGFWLRDHAIFTSIYLNLRVVASISRSLQSRLNKRGSVALVSQIELNKRKVDSQYDMNTFSKYKSSLFLIDMVHILWVIHRDTEGAP